MATNKGKSDSKGKSDKQSKKKIIRKFQRGVVHIQSTFNNTLVSVSDMEGNVVSWSSSGSLGFKGAKKSTPFASQMVTTVALETAAKFGVQEVFVYVKGPGFGRESAVRSVAKAGIRVLEIRDVTGIPHNGCRSKKMRRI